MPTTVVIFQGFSAHVTNQPIWLIGFAITPVFKPVAGLYAPTIKLNVSIVAATGCRLSTKT